MAIARDIHIQTYYVQRKSTKCLDFNDFGNKIYSTQLGIGNFPEVDSRKAAELLFFTMRMGKFKIQPEKIQGM